MSSQQTKADEREAVLQALRGVVRDSTSTRPCFPARRVAERTELSRARTGAWLTALAGGSTSMVRDEPPADDVALSVYTDRNRGNVYRVLVEESDL